CSYSRSPAIVCAHPSFMLTICITLAMLTILNHACCLQSTILAATNPKSSPFACVSVTCRLSTYSCSHLLAAAHVHKHSLAFDFICIHMHVSIEIMVYWTYLCTNAILQSH